MTLVKSITAVVTWLSSALTAQNHVPPRILKAVEHTESRGYWFAQSGSCIGVMQIMVRYSKVPKPLLYVGPINRLEGARHLYGWYRQANGSWRRALAGYNCGYQGLAGRCGGGYAAKILKHAGVNAK